MRILMLIALCFMISCAASVERYNTDYVSMVKKRASFDMNCSEEKLKATPVAVYPTGLYKQIGIEGCGKRGVYVQVRPNEWVLNSNIR